MTTTDFKSFHYLENGDVSFSMFDTIKSSKKLVIEVPFYQEGKKQFTFDVSSLKWD